MFGSLVAFDNKNFITFLSTSQKLMLKPSSVATDSQKNNTETIRAHPKLFLRFVLSGCCFGFAIGIAVGMLIVRQA